MPKQNNTKKFSGHKMVNTRELLLRLGFKEKKHPEGWCKVIIPMRRPNDLDD